jgi:hypothetical protein
VKFPVAPVCPFTSTTALLSESKRSADKPLVGVPEFALALIVTWSRPAPAGEVVTPTGGRGAQEVGIVVPVDVAVAGGRIAVAVAVGISVAVGVAISVGVTVLVTVLDVVGVQVGSTVGVSVPVAVLVLVAVGVALEVEVGVIVAVGTVTTNGLLIARRLKLSLLNSRSS